MGKLFFYFFSIFFLTSYKIRLILYNKKVIGKSIKLIQRRPKMTQIEKIKEAIAGDPWETYDSEPLGVRFDERQLENLDIFDNSLDNREREDERDFPEYGDSDAEELDGTSCYDVDYIRRQRNDTSLIWGHCYIVRGPDKGVHPMPDAGEILIKECQIVDQIF